MPKGAGVVSKSDRLLEGVRTGKVRSLDDGVKVSDLSRIAVADALRRLKEQGLVTYEKKHQRAIEWSTLKAVGGATKPTPAKATKRKAGKVPKRGGKKPRSLRRASPAVKAKIEARMIVSFDGLKRIQHAAEGVQRSAGELADAVALVVGESESVAPLLAPLAEFVQQLGAVKMTSASPAPKVARPRSKRTAAARLPQPSADDEEEPVTPLAREIKKLNDEGIDVHVNGDKNMPAESARAIGQIARAAASQLREGEFAQPVVHLEADTLRMTGSRGGLPELEIDGETFTVENEKGELLLGARTLGKVLGHHLATPERTRVVFHRRRDGKATDVFLTPWVPA